MAIQTTHTVAGGAVQYIHTHPAPSFTCCGPSPLLPVHVQRHAHVWSADLYLTNGITTETSESAWAPSIVLWLSSLAVDSTRYPSFRNARRSRASRPPLSASPPASRVLFDIHSGTIMHACVSFKSMYIFVLSFFFSRFYRSQRLVQLKGLPCRMTTKETMLVSNPTWFVEVL